MTRNTVFATLFLLLLSCSAASNSLGNEPQISETQGQQLSRLASSAIHQYGIVGQSIAVLKNGRLVWLHNDGLVSTGGDTPVTSNTIFPVYSVTKLFVAAVVTKLVHLEKLDVHKPISHYLDNLPENWRQIQVRDLLAHASGLPEYFSLTTQISEDPWEIIATLKNKPFVFETGRQFRYNQTNFLLLKLIIEKAFSASWQQIVETEITAPLALDKTVFGGSERDIPGRVPHHYFREQGELKDSGVPVFTTTTYSSTGLNSSAADLAKWFSNLVSGQYVPQNALWDSWQPYRLNNGSAGEYSHGWQWQKEEKVTAVGHYGGNIINVRHFFLNTNKSENVTVIHLNNGGHTSVFSFFDFAYQLAQVVDPDIVMETIELKKTLLEAYRDEDFARLKALYLRFKSERHNRARNTERLIDDFGWQILDTHPVMARDIFKLNLEDYPDSAITHDSYAEGLYLTGKYQQAKHYFTKALKMDPSFSHIPALLDEIEAQLTAQNSTE